MNKKHKNPPFLQYVCRSLSLLYNMRTSCSSYAVIPLSTSNACITHTCHQYFMFYQNYMFRQNFTFCQYFMCCRNFTFRRHSTVLRTPSENGTVGANPVSSCNSRISAHKYITCLS